MSRRWRALILSLAAATALPAPGQATTCRPLRELLYFSCRYGKCTPRFRVNQQLTYYCRRRHVVDTVPPDLARALEPALLAFAGAGPVDLEVRHLRFSYRPAALEYDSEFLRDPEVVELPDSGAGSAVALRDHYEQLAAVEQRAWERRRFLEKVLVPLVVLVLVWSVLVFDGRVGRRLGGWRFVLAGGAQLALLIYGLQAVNMPNRPPSAALSSLAFLVVLVEVSVAAWRVLRRVIKRS